MLGGAVLTIAAALERARGSGPAGQIPLTRNEIAHLPAVIIPITARHRSPDALVRLATPPSVPRPDLPLQAASSPGRESLAVDGRSTTA